MNFADDSDALRRPPSTIVSALVMDRTLRHLFVEGRTDRLFLRWLTDGQLTCQIHSVDTVDVVVGRGGNRARAVQLAEILRSELGSDEPALNRVRVFIDADFDHLDGNSASLPLVLTDGRSMESYFLRLECFSKIFGLALMNEAVDDEEIFDATVEVGRILAGVREIDRRLSLELPFQASDIGKFVEVDEAGRPSLRLYDMLSILLQRAGLSSPVGEILEPVEEVVDVLRSSDPVVVVHGHDLECVLGEVLQKMGYQRSHTAELLRCSFERGDVSEFPVLSRIVAFAVAA